MNKGIKWLLILAPVGVAGYFIMKKFGGAKKSQDKPPGDPTPDSKVDVSLAGELRPAVQKYFPLKKGSTGAKVIELQRAILSYQPSLLPKYKDDGDYGTETANAVSKLLGKSTVDGQDEIDKIKTMAANKNATASAIQATSDAVNQRKALAQQLSQQWAGNHNLGLYADHDTQTAYGILDAGGAEREVQNKVWAGGAKILSGSDISEVQTTSNGMLRMLSNNGKKFVRVSPYGVYFK